MNKKIITLVFSMLVFGVAPAFADISTNLDRVRWKSGTFNWKDHESYPQWKNEGIWTEYRKRVYISEYYKPAKSSAKTLVLIMAGQQGSAGLSGSSNCITGQDSNWDNSWGKGDKSKTKYLASGSLAERLINSGRFSSYDTAISVVFDANFNYEYTASAKNKAEEAFTDYLLNKGYSSTVDKIILVGSSRGGALATRMSKNIKQRSGWSNVPVYVGLVDAVPNRSQNELETQGNPQCINPLNSSYYARQADLGSYFSGLNKPIIRHVVTGAPVISLGGVGVIHGFCANSSSWYSQSWANLTHTEIGRCNSSEGAAYNQAKMNAGIVVIYDWLMSVI
jgi:hypothetical protein